MRQTRDLLDRDVAFLRARLAGADGASTDANSALMSLLTDYDAMVQLDHRGPFPHGITRLGALAEHVRILSTQNVAGLDQKLSPIFKLHWDPFTKLEYELQVAALLTRHGHEVAFVSEIPNQRTHDLWVTVDGDKIAIECKRKSHLSEAEDRSVALWEKLSASLLRSAAAATCNVHINTDSFLTNNSFQALLHQVEKALEKGFRGKLEIQPGLVATFTHSNRRRRRGILHPDHEVKAFHATDRKVRCIASVSMRCTAYDTTFPKKLESILSTLRDARAQLPPDSPSLIYLDLNGIDAQVKLSDQQRLLNTVEAWALRNHAVSAVVLTTQHFLRSAQSRETSLRGWAVIFKSSQPKHPLPGALQLNRLWGIPEEARAFEFHGAIGAPTPWNDHAQAEFKLRDMQP